MNKTFQKVLSTNEPNQNTYLKNHAKIRTKILQQKKAFKRNNLEDVTMVLNQNDLNNISEKKYSEISTEQNICSICQVKAGHTIYNK